MANHVLNEPRYTLEGDDWGEFMPAEYAWHRGRREVILQVATTTQLVEILADYLQEEMLPLHAVNEILKGNNCGFRFKDNAQLVGEVDIRVAISPAAEIDDASVEDQHPNIRKLVERMDAARDQQDPSGVLHTSASIFETLAKDVVGSPTIQNQTLGGFFAKYRNVSQMSDPILDYILKIYQERNAHPLAGHGSTQEPTITMNEATALAEFTKAIVRIERQLQQAIVTPEQKQSLKKSAQASQPKAQNSTPGTSPT